MDIRKYNLDGEWLTFDLETTIDIGPMKFKVQPIGLMDIERAAKDIEEMTSLCSRAVVDWDMTDGDHPLKCTADNKHKYLGKFLTFAVAKLNGEQPTRELEGEQVPRKINIGLAILEYCSEPNNFIKK